MSWIRRSAARVVLGAAAAIVMAGLSTPAWAAKADQEYVKYYTVTSKYQGKPENLTEISARLLGDGKRSTELFNLNTGRKQPDGGLLTDPASLRPGWMLVLPWDANGSTVQYGVLPTKSPRSAQPKPAPEAGRTESSTTPSGTGNSAATKPSKGKKAKSGQAPKPKPGQCATTSASSTRSDWAALRLAADQAWPQSRGKGQLVAIVDSGVDGSLPQLAGHVAVGTDIVGGSGRGDTDCLGSGTAMAGLIVAQANQGSGVAGMAPDATVMPVRVTAKDGKARASDSAAGIGSAVSEGATVIALGAYVDLTDPEVAKAANQAIEKGVVVVAGAALSSVPVNTKADVSAGVLRVGGIGVDGQAAADYRSGGVHVVAPGVNVSSVGITGTGAIAVSGTSYAVGFVAGEAALIRSAYPDLSADQVAHRIQVTSDKVRDVQPDGRYGWGLINPAVSVTKVLPEEAAAETGERKSMRLGEPAKGRSTLLIIIALVATAAAVLLVLRIRKMLLDNEEDDNAEAEPALGDRQGPPPPPPAPPTQHIPPAPPAPPTQHIPPAPPGAVLLPPAAPTTTLTPVEPGIPAAPAVPPAPTEAARPLVSPMSATTVVQDSAAGSAEKKPRKTETAVTDVL
ncbi:S8 family serine peptidase [Actinoplanes sp. NPDC049265]|uniref:S8 family serine peptidase n=1 Tax=Actinoplanes sp. NPDC049265 TaxID=3363902 RepID=UPI00371EF791